MLEMSFVRANPVAVRKNIARRNNPVQLNLFDKLLKKDKQWREFKLKEDALRQERNKLTEDVKIAKSQKKDVSKILEKAKLVPKKIAELQATVRVLKEETDSLRKRVPNILHESVPVGKDENDNILVRMHGEKTKPKFKLKHHGELAQEKDLVDFNKAVEVSGAGFYYLKGKLALLDLALQRFAVDELAKNGFELVIPPFMMRREPYEGVTDLADFENVMYKIEGDDLYLIATSEHPIAAMKMNEIIPENELPLKYCGLSQCFRREIGKHSIDERGLFRVHQFSKVEMFAFCLPEDSWKLHEEMIFIAESIVKKLEFPFEVVNVCTGDIGSIAAKKYDIEAWSPREQKFFEIISCSNCLSYQSSRLKIRYRKGNVKGLVHTLNSTALATSRILRVILENNQQEDGSVKVPKVLQPYMNGIKEL